MSESFSLYLIDETLLPAENLGMSDQEIYDALVAAVETNGKLHQVVEMTEDDFVDSLESIDSAVEGNRMLPICAMNNSPFEMLDKNSDTPFFGFFSPAQVQTMFYLFEALPEDALDTLESVETHAEVLEAFRTASSDAIDYDYALAVVHG